MSKRNDSSTSACWPLPIEWDTFIPPQAVQIKSETVALENGGGTLTRPVWNEAWLRGLESYVRSIVRDEIAKANSALDGSDPLPQERKTRDGIRYDGRL